MNNYYNKEIATKAISDVIDSGLKQMNSSLTEKTFDVWFDYSKKVLELVTKNVNPSILLNYLRLNLEFYGKTPMQRIEVCLKYLIEIISLL